MFSKQLSVITICFTILCAGCISQSQNAGGHFSPITPRAIKYPVNVTDQLGTSIKLEQQPKRIVSLIPSNTEIAYALHLEKELVAGTTNDDFPVQASKLTKIGDMKINIEQVVFMKPDLVLAHIANGKETIEQLRRMKLKVFVIKADSIKEIERAIALIGMATNRAREADQLIARMEKQKRELFYLISSIPKQDRLRVWLEIDDNLFTVGKGTFLDEIVSMAGGKNVAVNLNRWASTSPEQVVIWNPEVIISLHGNVTGIKQRNGWQQIDAVKNNRVYALDPNLISRTGPRVIEGIEEVANKLYPKLRQK